MHAPTLASIFALAAAIASSAALPTNADAAVSPWFDAGIGDYESWPSDGSQFAVEGQGTWTETSGAEFDAAERVLVARESVTFAAAEARDAAEAQVVFRSRVEVAELRDAGDLEPLAPRVKGALAAASDGGTAGFYGWVLAENGEGGAEGRWVALAGAEKAPEPGASFEATVRADTGENGDLFVRYEVDGVELFADPSSGSSEWTPVLKAGTTGAFRSATTASSGGSATAISHAALGGANLKIASLSGETSFATWLLSLPELPENVAASVYAFDSEVLPYGGVYEVPDGVKVVVSFAAADGWRLVGAPATAELFLSADTLFDSASVPTAEPIPVHAFALPGELPPNVSVASVTVDGVAAEPDENGVYSVREGSTVVVSFAAAGGWFLVGAADVSLVVEADAVLAAESVPTAADAASFVSINEIMASNPDPAKDPAALVSINGGAEMDWVELYNAADVDIDLAGWYFSDKPNKPTKSPIYGSCIVPAHGYKIVFLDDSYQNWDPSEAHADIGLSSGGEAAVLTRPDGTILQSIEFPAQIKGYSYGPGTVSYGPHAGDGPYVYMKTATPGAANVTEGWGDFTPTVQFSEPHGYKTEPFALALSCPSDPSAEIRYTLDGSSPTAESPLYEGPIDISRTTVVRAAVPDAGSVLQADASATYLYLDDILAQEQSTAAPETAVGFPDSGAVKGHKMLYGMRQSVVSGKDRDRLLRGFTNSVATVSLVVDPASLFDPASGIYANPQGRGQEWERQLMVEQINPLDPADGFSVPAGLRIRGSNSRNASHPKHSFRLFFRSSYGMSSLEWPLFPGDPTAATEFDKIDFRCSQNFSWANESDAQDTFIHEVFSRDAQGDLGQFHTRSRYYNLFVNGQYWGLYQTQERGEEHFAESYAGGDSLDWDVIKTTSANGGYQLEADEGTMDGWSNLWEVATSQGFSGEYASNYARVLGCNPDGTRNPDYPELLNPTNLMVYALVTHYVVDGDGPVTPQSKHLNNMYCLYDRTGGPTSVHGFFFLRHDGEMSFGKRGNVGPKADPTGWGSGDPSTVDSFNRYDEFWNTLEGFSPVKLHWELEKNPDYRRACADLLYKHFLRPGGAMTTEKNIERFARRMAEIDDAIVCEAARWGAGPNGTGNVGSRDAWLAACRTCTNGFLAVRMPYFVAQYKARGWYPSVEAPLAVDAAGEPHSSGDALEAGERVFLACGTDGAALWYTVDGSDPLSSDGLEPTASASLYDPEVGISLAGPAKLLARAVKDSEWSALEDVALVGVSDEFADLASALRVAAIYTSTAGGKGDEGEFVVLTNVLSDAAIDLAGARLVAWNAKKKSEADPSLAIEFGSLVIDPNGSVVLDQKTWFGGGKLTNSDVGLRLYDASSALVQEIFVSADWWNSTCDETGRWFVAKTFGPEARTDADWEPSPLPSPALPLPADPDARAVVLAAVEADPGVADWLSAVAGTPEGLAAVEGFVGDAEALDLCYLLGIPPEAAPEVALAIPSISFDGDGNLIVGGALSLHGEEIERTVRGEVRLYYAPSIRELDDSETFVPVDPPAFPAEIRAADADALPPARFFRLKIQ